MITKDIIELVKQTANVDLILASIGIHLRSVRGNQGRCSCPFHASSNNTSFSIDLLTGRWSCFSAGCHAGYSDIIGLVQLSTRMSFYESVKHIAQLSGVDLEEVKDNEQVLDLAMARKDLYDFISRNNTREIDLCTIPNIEEIILEWCSHRSDYFLQQGYNQHIHNYFEIGTRVDKFGIERACFPVRDTYGKIVAWDGRRTDQIKDMKYFIEPPSFQKNLVLYNYHKAKNYIKQYGGDVYVVEGYKGCWSMIQHGYFNTVACMGKRLLRGQMQILLSDLDIRRIFIMFDGDVAGRNGAIASLRMLTGLANMHIIEMPDGQDPSTLTAKQLDDLLYKNIMSTGENYGRSL